MKLRDQFSTFLAYKKAEGCSSHTLGEYRRFLSTLEPIGDKDVHELKKTDDVLVREAGRYHGYFGEQRAVSTYRQFLKFLEDAGHQIPFKWEQIPVPYVRYRDQDYLTPPEFEDLISKLPTDFYGLRDRILYELLWSTGLRIGEALAIDIKDINFADREIFVHTAKGGEGDKVYISDRMDFWLKKYLEQRKDNCPALFVIYFFEIRRLKKCQARRNLAGYRNEFGITKRITHHAFRRGFCTHLLNQGATIKEVQYLARHRSERTTLRFYCKVEKGKVKNVHERIFGGMPFQKTESAVALARGLAPEPALESVQE